MTHEELMARLERERISYPDALEAERYAADPLPVPHRRVWGPVTPQQAERHYALLEQIADRYGDGELAENSEDD